MQWKDCAMLFEWPLTCLVVISVGDENETSDSGNGRLCSDAPDHSDYTSSGEKVRQFR
jgi:hypothetical protein